MSTKGTNAPKRFFQVLDSRDSHFRKIGTVIATHRNNQFPICLQFTDAEVKVFHAYQVRQVTVKQKATHDKHEASV